MEKGTVPVQPLRAGLPGEGCPPPLPRPQRGRGRGAGGEGEGPSKAQIFDHARRSATRVSDHCQGEKAGH